MYDLEQAELCYAPQFGAAKDPVNLAGMIAANVLRGDHPVAHWRDLPARAKCWLLDVRDSEGVRPRGTSPAPSISRSVSCARAWTRVPADRDIWVYCAVGQRAYYATRALLQRGRRIRNLSGGMSSWRSEARVSS